MQHKRTIIISAIVAILLVLGLVYSSQVLWSQNHSIPSSTQDVSSFVERSQNLYMHPTSSPICSPPDLVNISADDFLSLKVTSSDTLLLSGIPYHYEVLNQSSGAAQIDNYTVSYGRPISSSTYSAGYPVTFSIQWVNGTRIGGFTYYVVLQQISSYPVSVIVYRIANAFFAFVNYDPGCSTSYQSMWLVAVTS